MSQRHTSAFPHIVKIMIVIAMAVVSTACGDTPEDSIINFVGDSIIARWDINQSFPSYCVYNDGVGGSGIDLIESYRSKFIGSDVVVITGTNNHNQFRDTQYKEYAERYVSSILQLTDGEIFLFSVLPREFPGDKEDINNDIARFNAYVEASVKNIDRVCYIDAFPDFLKGEGINHMYYSDGLHPNDIGYEILTQKLLKAL